MKTMKTPAPPKAPPAHVVRAKEHVEEMIMCYKSWLKMGATPTRAIARTAVKFKVTERTLRQHIK